MFNTENDIGNPGTGLGQGQNCGGVIPVFHTKQTNDCYWTKNDFVLSFGNLTY